MKMNTVLFVQAIYYFLTGMWPIVHINSFLLITGNKTDIFLVKMVGLLTTAIAITLFRCSKRDLETGKWLGVSAALAYLSIDLYYAGKNVISPVYIGDAVIEAIIVICLIASRIRPEHK
jgi:hypothetical protein